MFCKKYDLQTVPVEKVEVFDVSTMDEIIEIGNTCKYPNGELGEGFVVRPVVERYSEVLSSRASFKIISNKYLLKHGKNA